MNFFKTVLATTLVSGIMFSGVAFAQSATPPTAVVAKATPVVSAPVDKNPHQITLLFVKDGCNVYSFYSEGTRHTLVTGKANGNNTSISCSLK